MTDGISSYLKGAYDFQYVNNQKSQCQQFVFWNIFAWKINKVNVRILFKVCF